MKSYNTLSKHMRWSFRMLWISSLLRKTNCRVLYLRCLSSASIKSSAFLDFLCSCVRRNLVRFWSYVCLYVYCNTDFRRKNPKLFFFRQWAYLDLTRVLTKGEVKKWNLSVTDFVLQREEIGTLSHLARLSVKLDILRYLCHFSRINPLLLLSKCFLPVSS